MKRQSRLMSGKLHAVAVEKKTRRSLRHPAPAATDDVDFVLFFADGPGQSYQVEQWLAPFAALQARGHGVCLVVMNALSARILDATGNLPVLLTRSMEHIQETLESWGTSGIFYVNNSQANFTMLRASGPAHIHLSHGESEKSSMVSNQLKAYDFAFIAGEAARDRILAHIPRFDPAKLVQIGRPQLDVGGASTKPPGVSPRINVLYAPTWEGDGKDMAYSSVTSVGTGLVAALLRDERFRVTFRPHPKTGTWCEKTRLELRQMEKSMAEARDRDPGAGHRVETSGDASLAILGSDIVICDISAMAMDAVGLGRPLLLLRSVDTALSADLAPEQTLSLDEARTALAADNGRQLLDSIASMGRSVPSAEQLALRRKVFGEPALGTATERFMQAAVTATGAGARP